VTEAQCIGVTKSAFLFGREAGFATPVPGTTSLLQRDEHLDHASPFLQQLQRLSNHRTKHSAPVRPFHGMARSRSLVLIHHLM